MKLVLILKNKSDYTAETTKKKRKKKIILMIILIWQIDLSQQFLKTVSVMFQLKLTPP